MSCQLAVDGPAEVLGVNGTKCLCSEKLLGCCLCFMFAAGFICLRLCVGKNQKGRKAGFTQLTSAGYQAEAKRKATSAGRHRWW